MWEFMVTLGKGIIQGFKQYIDNDLKDYIPLFIIALLILIASTVSRLIRKFLFRDFYYQRHVAVFQYIYHAVFVECNAAAGVGLRAKVI